MATFDLPPYTGLDGPVLTKTLLTASAEQTRTALARAGHALSVQRGELLEKSPAELMNPDMLRDLAASLDRTTEDVRTLAYTLRLRAQAMASLQARLAEEQVLPAGVPAWMAGTLAPSAAPGTTVGDR